MLCCTLFADDAHPAHATLQRELCQIREFLFTFPDVGEADGSFKDFGVVDGELCLVG